MKRLTKDDQFYVVHMSHCNQGGNEYVCRYGEEDICPMLKDEKIMYYKDHQIKQLALNLIHALHTNIREDGFILASDITPEMMEVETYFDERDIKLCQKLN